MNKLLTVASCAALLCGAAAAHEPAPKDGPSLYAQTIPVTVSGKEALAQMRVPQAAYLASRSADLDDLRLFDRNGQPLRFALRTPGPRVDQAVSSSAVTIFPVRAAAGADGGASLDIRTSSDGKLISVNTRSVNEVKPGDVLSALVLDLQADGKAASGPVVALRLQPPTGTDNYTARIGIEVSDDLKRWSSAGEAAVSWLRNADGKTLASDRIELDAGNVRYARLVWREGAALQFAAISAERRSGQPAQRTLETMLIAGRPGKVAGDIVYPAALALPVRSVGLQFGEQNVVTPALLGHYVELPALRSGEPARVDLEPLLRSTFYRLNQGGKVRASGDLTVDETHVDEWVLRPNAPLVPPPSLRIAWEPATIVFLASGAAPYTLAVGRDKVKNAAQDLTSVAPGFGDTELAQLETAVAGAAQVQNVAGPAPGAAQQAAAAARTRTIILWSVLVLGVLAVALMARQLMRQMPKDGVPPED